MFLSGTFVLGIGGRLLRQWIATAIVAALLVVAAVVITSIVSPDTSQMTNAFRPPHVRCLAEVESEAGLITCPPWSN